MKPGWFIGFALAFVLLTLVFTVGEMVWIESEAAPLFVIMSPFKYGAAAWMGALMNMITFKYTFFSGSWIIVRWILMLTVSAGFVVGLAISLAQGIASAVGGLFRAILPR